MPDSVKEVVPQVVVDPTDYKKVLDRLNKIDEKIEFVNSEISQRLGKKVGRDIGILYGMVFAILIILVYLIVFVIPK
ncbi:MAG TPA: tetrahydromethanopterin S-methyltransferase subunit G [Methanosarcinales archaeon]|nr:tetrahydromethanopterin S-methyltransferase subunit G [Methanosarcinales archaeon]